MKSDYLKYGLGLLIGLFIFSQLFGGPQNIVGYAVYPVNDRVSVVFGEGTSPWSGLSIIAHELGFFEKAGVEVDLKPFTSAKLAHESLVGGGLDMATSVDVPMVVSTFVKPRNFKIVGNTMKTKNGVKLLVLNDRIKTPKDIEGKKIATWFTSVTHYFHVQFMEKHGIDPKKVELVNLKPHEMPAALQSGTIDGYFAWEPFIYQGKTIQGGKVTVYEDSYLYLGSTSLTVSNSFLKDHPGEVEKVLSALKMAQGYIEENPKEAKVVLADYLSMDQDSFDDIFDDYVYSLSLEPDLIDSLKSQQRWVVAEGLQPDDIDPIEGYIDEVPLRNLKLA